MRWFENTESQTESFYCAPLLLCSDYLCSSKVCIRRAVLKTSSPETLSAPSPTLAAIYQYSVLRARGDSGPHTKMLFSRFTSVRKITVMQFPFEGPNVDIPVVFGDRGQL